MADRDTRPQQHHATTTPICEPQAHCYRVGQPTRPAAAAHHFRPLAGALGLAPGTGGGGHRCEEAADY